MWWLTAVAVAAGLAMVADADAAGFWLPPSFGENNPYLALAVGDSITRGTLAGGGTAAQPYPLILQGLLAPAHPGFVVANRGVGGETTSEGLARLATVLAADHPGFVLIMEGTNDATFGRSPGLIVANLRAMVQLAKANFSIPVLAAIVPNHRDYAPEAQEIIEEVNARLPGVAAAEGVRFVNTFAPMSDPELFGSDALHPTQQGYAVLAAAWRPAVSAAITESRVLVTGVTVGVGAVDHLAGAEIVTGPGAGNGPHIKVFQANGSQLGPGFFAYDPAFRGGVRVASGCDFDGDGRDEIITGPGPGGGPHVRVFKLDTSGAFVELASFFAYDPAFIGGVFVACGPVEGPGVVNIVTGPGPGGGPHVRIFRYTPGAPGGVLPAFDAFAYDPAFAGGVQVAVGDVDNDGRAEIITGPGPGGGPHVRVLTFTGTTLVDPANFFAYDPSFTGGVFVATGDVTGDGVADILTGAGPGGGPHVRAFSGAGLPLGGGFFAYPPTFAGGVRVAGGSVAGDAVAEIVTAPGPAPGNSPHVLGLSITGVVTGPDFLAY